MNPAALCELDTIDADQAVSLAAIRSVAALLQALAAEWEPAPMSTFYGASLPSRRGPVQACQIASGTPGRTLSARRDLGLWTATDPSTSGRVVATSPGRGAEKPGTSASVETHGASPGGRAGVAVASARSDRLLAVAAALTLAPLFPLLARGGWG